MTYIFTHQSSPPKVLHSASLPAFAHGVHQTRVNQTSLDNSLLVGANRA